MRFSALGLSALLVSAASAQTAPAPVAYVYVATNPASTGASGHIYGFAASSAGKLTPVSGSPLASTVNSIALNGKWLFGTAYDPNNGPYTVNSYSIATTGSLKLVDSATIDNGIQGNGGQPVFAFLDHSGATLYADLYDSDNVAPQALTINQTTGKVTPGAIAGPSAGASALTFTGNNEFAYGVSCFQNSPYIVGYMRRPSDGALSIIGRVGSTPAAPANSFYCTYAQATDPYNDVVISLPQISSDGTHTLGYKLAVYTADSTGKLTTTSTAANMPSAKVEGYNLAMSPKGVYLASAGASGMQLFLMHGSKPLTVLTPNVILPGIFISQMFWDNNQHLYALAGPTNQLFVFNVTSSGATQASGSPYPVANAANLIVLPK